MKTLTLRDLVDTLVAARHAGGFRYKSQARVLGQFAGHCGREGYADGSIIQEAVEEFLYGRHLKASTVRRQEIVLRELAEQNLAKAHYLAGKLRPRFSGPFFNEFVVSTNGRPPEEINRALLEKKIVGGLPLGRFYPELSGAMLLCATEMARREHMDALASVF